MDTNVLRSSVKRLFAIFSLLSASFEFFRKVFLKVRPCIVFLATIAESDRIVVEIDKNIDLVIKQSLTG